MIGGWALAASRPLAFGGWEFTITGPVEAKRVEWWPTDPYLTWHGQPMRSAPVPKNSGKAARAAAQALVDRLNEQEEAA